MSVRSTAGSIRVMMRQNALSAEIRRCVKIKDTGRDFLEEVMVDRIDEILSKDRKVVDEFYDAQDKILDTLVTETKAKLEEFACNILLLHAKELQAVYKEAFFDGLRLGHKVF